MVAAKGWPWLRLHKKMSTFNAPAGRSLRASNTEAGSMMLRGSCCNSSPMDYYLLALIHNPLLAARRRSGLLFRLRFPLGCHCRLLRALWLGRLALGWRRFETGALRHVEAEHRGEVLASETLARGRRLLPEWRCLARAGEQFQLVHAPQAEQQLRLVIEPRADAIQYRCDMLAHVRPVRATA